MNHYNYQSPHAACGVQPRTHTCRSVSIASCRPAPSSEAKSPEEILLYVFISLRALITPRHGSRPASLSISLAAASAWLQLWRRLDRDWLTEPQKYGSAGRLKYPSIRFAENLPYCTDRSPHAPHFRRNQRITHWCEQSLHRVFCPPRGGVPLWFSSSRQSD